MSKEVKNFEQMNPKELKEVLLLFHKYNMDFRTSQVDESNVEQVYGHFYNQLDFLSKYGNKVPGVSEEYIGELQSWLDDTLETLEKRYPSILGVDEHFETASLAESQGQDGATSRSSSRSRHSNAEDVAGSEASVAVLRRSPTAQSTRRTAESRMAERGKLQSEASSSVSGDLEEEGGEYRRAPVGRAKYAAAGGGDHESITETSSAGNDVSGIDRRLQRRMVPSESDVKSSDRASSQESSAVDDVLAVPPLPASLAEEFQEQFAHSPQHLTQEALERSASREDRDVGSFQSDATSQWVAEQQALRSGHSEAQKRAVPEREQDHGYDSSGSLETDGAQRDMEQRHEHAPSYNVGETREETKATLSEGKIRVYEVDGPGGDYIRRSMEDFLIERFHDNPRAPEMVRSADSAILARALEDAHSDFVNSMSMRINNSIGLKELYEVPARDSGNRTEYPFADGKILVQTERNDGQVVDFNPEPGLNAVVRVQRRRGDGSLIDNDFDTIEYKDGQVVAVVEGKEGISRLGRIGLPGGRDLSSKSEERKRNSGIVVFDASQSGGHVLEADERQVGTMMSHLEAGSVIPAMQQGSHGGHDDRSRVGSDRTSVKHSPPRSFMGFGDHEGVVPVPQTPRPSTAATEEEFTVLRKGNASRAK